MRTESRGRARVELWMPMLAAAAVLVIVASWPDGRASSLHAPTTAEPSVDAGRRNQVDVPVPGDVRALDEASSTATTQGRAPDPGADRPPDSRQPAPVTRSRSTRRSFHDSMPKAKPALDAALSTLECRFILDDDVPEDAYDAVLVLRDGRVRRRHGIESGRRVRYDHLEPGFVSLAVELAQGGYEIERIPEIAVTYASTTNDARLDTIDVRGRVHALRARLLHPSGDPLALVDVRVDDGNGHAWKARTNAEGWVWAFVPLTIAALDAHVEGFQAVTFHSLDTLRLAAE